jgi:hypothetical protein
MWHCQGVEPAEVPQLGLLSCVRYLNGIMDMEAISVALGNRPIFCPPPTGISGDQVRRIFVKWAESHPKELHQTARTGAVLALREAFPCQ